MHRHDLAIITRTAILTLILGSSGLYLIRPALATTRTEREIRPVLQQGQLHIVAQTAGSATNPRLLLDLSNTSNQAQHMDVTVRLIRYDTGSMVSRALVPSPKAEESVLKLTAAPGNSQHEATLVLPPGNGLLTLLVQAGDQRITVPHTWQTGEK